LTDRYVCIHGHFYQPPRENPWLEAVETQDSAWPYHDWNERVTDECYSPNASARILDAKDRIAEIVNNYSQISFNFGPTLLSWMQVAAPETYQSILDADRRSGERFPGHGSAIAQGYNHIILPLASERDKRTQVRWGIRDFQHRFQRDPEGMWLPETAVDVASLEALAAQGIRFTILEPHQASQTRVIGAASWQDVNGGLDPTMPYRCSLPSGRSIDIFFYDGPISRAVAFEKLLARGEQFAHRIIGAFSDQRKHPQIVNIATDGETYGHHHRFGEMALAYALHYIEQQRLANLTTYGDFLARFPPTHEVRIHETTSWSCAHGVERWRSDCGCSTGAPPGWHQQWRAPLRAALDWLHDQVAPFFERAGGELLRDPWAARDEFIDVVLDRSPDVIDRFLAAQASRPLTDAERVRALELLEMQRNAMLMYTSCGWFFNDISGIETVQVIHYAGRVVQLAEKSGIGSLTPALLERLAAAKSNLAARGDARLIYEREVAPAMLDLPRVGAHYAAATLFENDHEEEPVYCYDLDRHDFDTDKAGRAKMAIGRIQVRSRLTCESELLSFALLHLGETDITGGVRHAGPIEDYEKVKRSLLDEFATGDFAATIRMLDRHFGNLTVSIRSLFRDEQRRIVRLLCDVTLSEAETAFRQLHEQYDPLMRLHARLNIPLPQVLKIAAEFDTNVQLRRMLERQDPPLQQIAELLESANRERIPLDESTRISVKDAIERFLIRLRRQPEDLDAVAMCEEAVELFREMRVEIDLRRPQNDYFEMRKSIRPAMAARAAQGDAAAREWLTRFDALGEKLSMSPAA
jgi:alpha-amylase/alpha-mannosidase (GH57 family)